MPQDHLTGPLPVWHNPCSVSPGEPDPVLEVSPQLLFQHPGTSGRIVPAFPVQKGTEALGGIPIQKKEKVFVLQDLLMDGGNVILNKWSSFFIISIQEVRDYGILVHIRIPEQLSGEVGTKFEQFTRMMTVLLEDPSCTIVSEKPDVGLEGMDVWKRGQEIRELCGISPRYECSP